jgi:hypothetical protein
MPEEMKRSLPEKFRGMFPRIIYTANPVGASVGYFRRHFVKARAPFAIEEIDGFTRQYIPSRIEDNPSEDPVAAKGRIRGLNDEATASALIEGNWDAPTGDFYPEWNEDYHVIPDLDFPEHWFRFRTFDWGTAEPFAAYWFCVSDGKAVSDHTGRSWFFPRGAFIAYREWYGCNAEDPAVGLRMRNQDVAAGILARSRAKCEHDLITLTDSLPFQDRGGDMIADVFAREGCVLTLGDTSRESGWSQLRSRLIGIEVDSNDHRRTPMIYFTRSCKYARDYIPSLPRHPTKREDAAEHGEATHACDAIRLGCMARTKIRDLAEPIPKTDNLRNEITFNVAIKRIQEKRERRHAY